MDINLITKEEASLIIETRQPIGLFYEVDGDLYIGIDNSTGDAWVEEFKTKEECLAWLKGEEHIEIDEKDIYRQALKKWGSTAQVIMVFEEMAELQKELSKFLRGNWIGDNIAEEIADVEIMLEQMKLLFGIEELVDINKKYKLKRLAERVKRQ